MKKLVMTTLTALNCCVAYALPIGNPSEASLMKNGIIWEKCCGDERNIFDPCINWCDILDTFSLRIGFYGDYVFNRHLQVKNVRTPTVDIHKTRDIESFQIFTNAGYIAGNIWNLFDVFATLGTTNINSDTNENIEPSITRNGRLEIETSTKFSWSVGARGTLLQCGCTSLGIEGQYFHNTNSVKRVTFEDSSSIYPPDDGLFKYREWQVGVGISHQINMLSPYIAAKWSNVHIHSKRGIETLKIENSKSWGYAVGCSLVSHDRATITVEGRFADEKALYVNGQVRF